MSELDQQSAKQFEAERLLSLAASPVPTTDGPQGADVLWQRFFSSPYAVYMDDQPYRFAQHFGFDRQAMVADIGMDVLPRDHQMQTGMFVAWILDREWEIHDRYPISPEDTGIVMLAAFIHDMGETMHPDIQEQVGAVVGDIAYGLKTDGDRAVEAAVRAAMYARLYPDVLPEAITKIEAIISHRDDSLLHDLFEAAHTAQAFNTALITGINWADHWWRQLESDDHAERDDHAMVQMARLFDAVLTNMIPEMRHWSAKFMFVKEFAEQHPDIMAQV